MSRYQHEIKHKDLLPKDKVVQRYRETLGQTEALGFQTCPSIESENDRVVSLWAYIKLADSGLQALIHFKWEMDRRSATEHQVKEAKKDGSLGKDAHHTNTEYVIAVMFYTLKIWTDEGWQTFAKEQNFLSLDRILEMLKTEMIGLKFFWKDR